MAFKHPVLSEDKVNYFRQQLYRELSCMFEWEGLPQTVPNDYLERNLVRYGYVLYYEDEIIGQDVLRCEIQGWNRHELPTDARTFTPNTIDEKTQITRKVKRLADSKTAVEDFDPTKDGVVIMNMNDSFLYRNSLAMIVEHFSQRLALAQQAFDTNLLWANVPYIFQTNSDDTKLSIEKMFTDIFTGKPFTIVDKSLLADNIDRTGVPTGITYIGKELLDTQNEIMMKFRETVGFNTAGVDKAERVNTLEVKSNDQHTYTVLQIMLQQREKACEEINAFFGTNLTVQLAGQDKLEMQQTEDEGEDEFGTGDSGAGTTNNEN